MKNLAIILILLAMGMNLCYSEEIKCHCHNCNNEKRQEIHKYIIEKLNLTEKQMELSTIQREIYLEKMNSLINKMQDLKEKIDIIYQKEQNKIKADFETANYKSELVKLRQEAKNLRENHRQNFEKILTEEQKLKFQELRIEIKNKFQ